MTAPSLPSMPLVPEKSPTPDNALSDPFEWDRDPLVLVSRRNRVLMFPGALLSREPTPDEVKRWNNYGPEMRTGDRDEKMLALQAGVNFLGAYTSSWAYRSVADVRGAPQGAPQPHLMTLLWPYTNGREAVVGPLSGNIDRETQRVRPDRVRAVLQRVVDYCRAHRAPTDVDLWTTPDGYDAPELQLIPLSEVFSQKGDGAQAHVTAFNSIRHLRATKDTTATLGGLHDYAVRIRSGQAIMTECRRWWAAKKLG